MGPFLNSNPQDPSASELREKDILFGKGTPTNVRKANKQFRAKVRACFDQYDNEPEGKKHLVAKAIVDSLYSEGYRFMKKNARGAWCEVPRKLAYGKTQQTLRDGAPKRREKRLAETKQAEVSPRSYEPGEASKVPNNTDWPPLSWSGMQSRAKGGDQEKQRLLEGSTEGLYGAVEVPLLDVEEEWDRCCQTIPATPQSLALEHDPFLAFLDSHPDPELDVFVDCPNGTLSTVIDRFYEG